ncbi:MAG TPA: hypothetical protein PKL84_14945, partial [Candidatus Hydrogenedentes bacterium]|nr:hypothetical protein [Candidatus Hydrogenedentota bacterium]
MVYPALIAAAAVLGTFATRPLGLVADLEGWLYRLLVGFGLCAVLAIGLGSYSLSLAATALYLIAALGLLWELRGARTRTRAAAGGETPSRAPLRLFDYACLAAIAGSLLLALISALAPVTSRDASVAHLALPAAYAREGRMIVLPGNVYSGYPHLLYSLYAIAYASAGEQAVTLLNWTFAALACLAVYVLGKRIEGPRCGLAAAALLATAPVFMDQAGEVAIDLGFTALTTASLAALVAWFEGARHGHAASDSSPLLQPSPQPSPSGRGSSVLPGRGFAPLVLSAALAGSACGVRHTGFLVCLLLGVGVLAGSRGARLRATALFSGIAVLAALPWLLRSALTVGNPVFPLLPSLFPTQGIEHVDLMALGGHESVRAAGGTGLVAFLRFPWDIIMRPHLYDGWTKSPGSVVLALGVPGLILGGRRARTLGAFSVAGGVFLFFIQRCARCLLPFFTPMMVVAAVMTNRAQWMRKGVAALLVFAFAYGLALHAVAIHVKIPVFLGGQTREQPGQVKEARP